MNSHAEIAALRAMAITNKFMLYALMKTHPDPAGLRAEFLEMTQAFIDEEHARGDNEICLKSLNAQIDAMDRMLAGQAISAQRDQGRLAQAG